MIIRVTQSDIARAAGVHNTTVSLALRNNPALPLATRVRIQKIARQLGYAPDPALQALVAYRKPGQADRREQTLAYVTNWGSRWGWKENIHEAKFFKGAEAKAADCGFKLQHFWFGEEGMDERRLAGILAQRGIAGLILASHRQDTEAFAAMDWSRLSAVKIGCFPHRPALHRVGHDQGGSLRQTLREIQACGYERIGLAVPNSVDSLADQAWSSAFFGEQFHLPAHLRVPLLSLEMPDLPALTEMGTAAAQLNLETLREWYHRFRPQVIVSAGSSLRQHLRALGLKVPTDVAYVDAFADGMDPTVAGMRENGEGVGAIAVELLVSQLQQNLHGVSPIAAATLIKGRWTPGETLPQRATGSSSAAWQTAVNEREAFSESCEMVP
jgi:LacI family transcriptional regulator